MGFAKLLYRLVVLFLMLFSVAATAYGEDDLKISEMAVTTKIVRGKPIDSVHRISSTSVKSLYCFTRVVGPGDETSIKHVWFRNGAKAFEEEMPVKGKRWRVYSMKRIDQASPGEWRVEAQTADGKLLQKIEFRIN